MTQLQALKELAEKVEAGTISGGELTPHYAVRGLWSNYTFPIKERAYAYSAYHGSLDAAHSLHKAVVSKWDWGTAVDAHGERYFFLETGDNEIDVYNTTPARAWLLAIIKAKISEIE